MSASTKFFDRCLGSGLDEVELAVLFRVVDDDSACWRRESDEARALSISGVTLVIVMSQAGRKPYEEMEVLSGSRCAAQESKLEELELLTELSCER
jgi:hypothetical protein